MGVSDIHINLVKELGIWVKQNCLPSEHHSMLLDLPETTLGNNPPIIGGFIPDLYMKSNRVIIGEAKTAGDLERQHTKDQLSAYIKHLNQQHESILIIAVPWYRVPLAKSIVRNLLKRLDATRITAVFLEKLPGQ